MTMTKTAVFDAIDEHIDWGEFEEDTVWPLIVECFATWIEDGGGGTLSRDVRLRAAEALRTEMSNE